MIGELKIMRGPNIWAKEHQRLIVLKLNESTISENDRETLCSKVVTLFPSLDKKIKDSGIVSGKGDPKLVVADLLSLLGMELQALSSPTVNYYKSHLLGGVSYYSVFEYEHEAHGAKAARVADKIITTLLSGGTYESAKEDMEILADIYDDHAEGPSTMEIVNAARARNIPVKQIAGGRYIGLGLGKYQKKISAAITSDTTDIAVDIAGDKSLTKTLLGEAMLPVPRGVVISTEEELDSALDSLGFPLVTKPLNGHQGKCITTDITKYETLKEGYHIAKAYGRRVIVEKYISGADYRFLVVNYKLVAAAKRSPALVVGDGKSTIRELIEEVNKDPLRGEGHNSVLTKIHVDQVTIQLIALQNRTLDSVLEKDKIQILKDTANLSTGGTAVDVTDEVHPENKRFAERAARIVGLDICGIDIMAPDVKTPFTENGGAIIEANAAPGLRMHVAPSAGSPRKVGKAIIEMMFPDNSEGRIPIIAITGTNGKTTTSRLMAHVVQAQGFRAGFTTTEGIYLDGQQIVKGDCSGPRSTSVVLDDPMTDFAVLEWARGGILRSGLAFDQCDVGIVTNVAADHLGMKDIFTVEDMARVKAVIPQAVKKDGYAILNAGIDLVLKMKNDLKCHVALFCLDGKNPNLQSHCRNGGIGAYLSAEGEIIIREGEKEIRIERAENIPITMKGKAGFMIENVLPVVLASHVMKFSIEKTREALKTFFPTEEQAPGRLNIVDIKDVHVMVDYAHNPHSIKAFSDFLNNIEEHKTGIITGVGDRRDADIKEVGQLAAGMYDDVIIRIDEDTRGRDPKQIIELLQQGINEVDPNVTCKVIPGTREALKYAVEHSKPGSYVVLNADSAQKTMKIVKEVKEEFGVN